MGDSHPSDGVSVISYDSGESNGPITIRKKLTVAILCFVNLVYYMDRFSMAGILPTIQCYYSIGDGEAGLLQTAFLLMCIIFAPAVGYLGDRYSRRLIMASGVAIWAAASLGSSFVGEQDFVIFIILRSLLGVGEASYSILAPAIISDLLKGDARSTALALFFFSVPVGSGLGYIIGSLPLSLNIDWKWGLRIAPALAALSVVFIALVMIDPPRGGSEGKSGTASSYLKDLKFLSRNKSYLLSTVGAVCVVFIAGAVGWWGPKFLALGQAVMFHSTDVAVDDIALYFGLITMICGLIGVPGGAVIASKLRPRIPNVDPLVCGIGLLISTICLYAVLICAEYSIEGTYVLVVLAQLSLNVNWAVTIEIIMFVVPPSRRATASAFQILTTHALGDAGSPFYIGLISEALKVSTRSVKKDPCSTSALNLEEFQPLQNALFVCVFVGAVGGALYLWNALYMEQDVESAKLESSLEEVSVKEGEEVAGCTE